MDDLANKLEIALSQSNQPETSQLTSFLSDDENDQSDKQQFPNTNSTITVSKEISFFSDDETSQEMIPPTSLVSTPILEQPAIVSEQMDSITPMDVELPPTTTKYISTLSEDDEENSPIVSSPLKSNKVPFRYQPQPSDKTSSLKKSNEPIRKNTKDQRTKSIITKDTLDSKRIQIVFRLLNVLIQVPVPLKPLRLVRRRIKQKPIPEEQVNLSTDDENIETPPIQILEQPKIIEHMDTTEEVTTPVEEIKKTSEEEHHDISQTEVQEVDTSISGVLEVTQTLVDSKQDDTTTDEVHQAPAEENLDIENKNTTTSEPQEKNQDKEEQQDFVEKNTIIEEVNTAVGGMQEENQSSQEPEERQDSITEVYEENINTEEKDTAINEGQEEKQDFVEKNVIIENPDTSISEVHEENLDIKEKDPVINVIQEEQQTSVEKEPVHGKELLNQNFRNKTFFYSLEPVAIPTKSITVAIPQQSTVSISYLLNFLSSFILF